MILIPDFLKNLNHTTRSSRSRALFSLHFRNCETLCNLPCCLLSSSIWFLIIYLTALTWSITKNFIMSGVNFFMSQEVAITECHNFFSNVLSPYMKKETSKKKFSKKMLILSSNSLKISPWPDKNWKNNKLAILRTIHFLYGSSEDKF